MDAYYLITIEIDYLVSPFVLNLIGPVLNTNKIILIPLTIRTNPTILCIFLGLVVDEWVSNRKRKKRWGENFTFESN